jgi:spermidine synthase
VLGLGTGVLGCYARPGEVWTFREIDPVVERLARDDRWFHFMADCGNHPSVVLGDARLTLTADTAARYDLVIVDVFSSDSVPVHMLTREALALYFARLKPGGIVLFHVSNRYLDLTPVVTRLAAEAGAPVRHLLVPPVGATRRRIGAEVVAVAAPGGELNALAADGWDVPQPGPVLWTDERSDILGAIRWR